MKKSKLLLSSLTLLAATLAGCGEKTSSEAPASSAPAESSEVVRNNGKFGFGNIATYAVTLPTATKKGSVTTEINYVSVLLDKEDKIVNLRLDTVQIKVSVDDEAKMVLTGKTVGNEGVDTRSKWELLDEYGMAGTSPIGKEWYLQAEAFENFAVGKTIDQLLTFQEGDDLKDGANAGVTIHVNGFMDAIERAKENLVEVEDITDLTIGVGGIGTVQTNQTNYTIAGAAFDKDEKVVAARMDVYQVPYTIVAATEEALAGIRVNDAANKKQVVAIDEKTGSIKSKHDLKEDYGMAGSATQGEWYVQANKITAYMIGKTLEEAYVLEGGKFVDANVGATIIATDYLNAFLEAEHTAFNARYTA